MAAKVNENGVHGLEPATKKCRAELTELQKFDEVFQQLVDDITKQGLKDGEIHDAFKWFKEVCEYNVPFGKKNRGMAVVSSYRYLVTEDKLTEDNLNKARILGWCVEWLQAFFLVADDIMDHSFTRRGKPCWYKKEGVGLIAINDSFFLEMCIYQILKKYFREETYYIDIVELFHETTLQTEIGQNLDLITAQDHVDFNSFSQERYNAIVKWKTAFYSFYLPVACAMYMAGISDSESHANAKTILLEMGHFFQVQDDYLDCYGDPAVIGKVGTDIQDNKCGWLIIQALKRASPEQIKILEENYACHDDLKVAKVKEIFNQLKLSELYTQYEEESYQDLMQLIEKYSQNLPKQMFIAFAKKIYKRNR
ncbi:farnesyl pyrophosphate synthase [Lingula anatina]|uniref:Farnesyl pyrophosphate synthase n=1 Tax=Lingula anatina TaxID=7574 RepID=A0A1S3JT86_LINAN|nr:farnesyl pyrophosphate synthase [Lingula anatina]|eukprot:XP_013413552.1 farnesyl pyrophosphate synthase [Lingula anatina]